MVSFVIRCALITAGLLSAIGCNTAPWRLGGVTLKPNDVAIAPGEQVQFEAGPPFGSFSWRVQEGTGHGRVNAEGLYSAPFLPVGREISVEVTRRVDGDQHVAIARVHLLGDADSADCAGLGQSALPGPWDDDPVDSMPVAEVRIAPAYPDSAREAGIQGTVVVRALVCWTGLVLETTIEESIPALDAAASAAVQLWEFRPAMRDGQAVAAWVSIPVRFVLN